MNILNKADDFIFLFSCSFKKLYLPYRDRDECFKIKNEMDCVIKFCYELGKTAPETVKLMKETYKNKCFGESAIFRWHGD